MGVDWIPCRVEPEISREEIERHVRLEALGYQLGCDGWCPPDLRQLIALTECERAQILRDYEDAGRLAEKLLFKMASHRVYVITCEELYPLEWRLEAYRTILPWELPEQIAIWQTYREEVARGAHRVYLQELLLYLRSVELVEFFRDTLLRNVREAQERSDSWATRPALAEVSAQILGCPSPEVPPPPIWATPLGKGQDSSDSVHASMQALRESQQQIASMVQAWNDTVQRGNRRIRDMPALPDLEDWVRQRLATGWFSSFLHWVDPYVRGEYGLYRDCE